MEKAIPVVKIWLQSKDEGQQFISIKIGTDYKTAPRALSTKFSKEYIEILDNNKCRKNGYITPIYAKSEYFPGQKLCVVFPPAYQRKLVEDICIKNLDCKKLRLIDLSDKEYDIDFTSNERQTINFNNNNIIVNLSGNDIIIENGSIINTL